MIPKIETLTRIMNAGIVAVVRADSEEQAEKISKACIEGGVPAIEVTFTVPGAQYVISSLKKKFPKEALIVGAGTVLDSETARIAILAGAEYIVSPGFDPETARLCNRYQIPYMAGCMTLTEIITAMEAGVDVIKVFPGSAFGPDFIKAIKGPLPQTVLMPTGGVSLDNVDQWIKNGCIAVGVGANMPTTPEGIAVFQKAKILYAPGKASNAGGVATSGLEMSQNSMRMRWFRKEVNERLHDIMISIHESCVKYGQEEGGYVNYVNGANIAGFVKVADAMIDQGLV